MMPQKRNPIVLERIRGLAGDAAGWGASRLGLLHFATSTDADQGYVHNRIPEYCRETAGATGLLREVLTTLDVDVEGFEQSASRQWSTASALADDLVSTHDMSFRAAHEVVARFIAAHEATGQPDGVVRLELAEEPLRRYSAARLSSVLDARSFVESRTSAGGTSTARRRELAAEAADDLDGHRSKVNALLKGIDEATSRLLTEARALVESD